VIPGDVLRGRRQTRAPAALPCGTPPAIIVVLCPRIEEPAVAESPFPKDVLEMMQKMWNPFMFPIPGAPLPTASVAELEKKIDELKIVENWLTMNVGLVQMTIKTLEMQKAALETLAAGAQDPKK
jgi:hypothetical protein